MQRLFLVIKGKLRQHKAEEVLVCFLLVFFPRLLEQLASSFLPWLPWATPVSGMEEDIFNPGKMKQPCSMRSLQPASRAWSKHRVRATPADWLLFLLRRRQSHSTNYSLWPSSSCHCQQRCCHRKDPVGWCGANRSAAFASFGRQASFGPCSLLSSGGRLNFVIAEVQLPWGFFLPLFSLPTTWLREQASPTMPGLCGLLQKLPSWGEVSPPSCCFCSRQLEAFNAFVSSDFYCFFSLLLFHFLLNCYFFIYIFPHLSRLNLKGEVTYFEVSTP